ncbi:MAG: Rieske 2Fe-2S domain-containing protein [Chloroflexi bacterium]|nr:Rieske 2Fe-2S domain-containing protein [Chloroflexota bacterium]
MLTAKQSKLLTATGPGTPMGDVIRRYWLPALLSWELPDPDCPPVRLRLLSEDLVAFRATDGRLGIIEEFCAHRGVSLWLGRNEENGLRCVFHGWKYDVDGQCIDQMNEPAPFAEKIRLRSYPAVELGGVIWVYMGPADDRPPEPRFAWTQVPQTHRHATKVLQESNWLQAFEGGIDVSHVPILHRSLTTSSAEGYATTDPFVAGSDLHLEVDLTDYGFRYFGVFALGPDETYVRAYHCVMPFTQIRPDKRDRVYGHYWVPVDDETCMTWNWYYSTTGEPLADAERSEERFGNGPAEVDQNTFVAHRNARNGYMLDRRHQKDRNFTGIEGINAQDRAVQESMGPGRIADRAREHLGPADKTIIAVRKMLFDAIKTVQDGGAPPGTGASHHAARATQRVVPKGTDWRAVVLPDMG